MTKSISSPTTPYSISSIVYKHNTDIYPLLNINIPYQVIFHGQCIESWKFHFGFVIPDSTNSWQQIIEAAAKDKMLPAEQLSGNVVFETAFYDGQDLLCTNSVRMFYVD